MERLQYYHHRDEWRQGNKYEYTIVCDVPSSKNLADLVSLALQNGKAYISIPFGKAEVHPKDMYCKKIGRDTALSKCSSKMFRLTCVDIIPGGKVCYYFVSDDDHLRLETKPGRSKPYLIKAY